MYSFSEKNEQEQIKNELAQYVWKHNDMIQKSRAKLTDVENKTILYLASKITKESKYDDWFVIDASNYVKVCGIGKGNIVYLKKILKKLADKSWWYRVEPKKEILIRWFDKIEVYDDPAQIRVRFHSEMAPFLFHLADTFTQFTLETSFSLEGKHTRTIYELMKSYIGDSNVRDAKNHADIEMLTDTFREKLGIENLKTYKDFSKLRVKIIEPAITNINEKTDIYIQCAIAKTGRGGKVEKLLFSVSRNSRHSDVIDGQKGIEDYE